MAVSANLLAWGNVDKDAHLAVPVGEFDGEVVALLRPHRTHVDNLVYPGGGPDAGFDGEAGCFDVGNVFVGGDGAERGPCTGAFEFAGDEQPSLVDGGGDFVAGGLVVEPIICEVVFDDPLRFEELPSGRGGAPSVGVPVAGGPVERLLIRDELFQVPACGVVVFVEAGEGSAAGQPFAGDGPDLEFRVGEDLVRHLVELEAVAEGDNVERAKPEFDHRPVILRSQRRLREPAAARGEGLGRRHRGLRRQRRTGEPAAGGERLRWFVLWFGPGCGGSIFRVGETGYHQPSLNPGIRAKMSCNTGFAELRTCSKMTSRDGGGATGFGARSANTSKPCICWRAGTVAPTGGAPAGPAGGGAGIVSGAAPCDPNGRPAACMAASVFCRDPCGNPFGTRSSFEATGYPLLDSVGGAG